MATTAPPTTGLREVNGVFKGGGAKGVAYAGALKAARERGLWFRSVAGASAGAITAALIAAGMGPEEIERAVPDALNAARASIPLRIGKAVIGHATSVFESRKLRTWLDGTLRACVGGDPAHPVTFAELYAAHHIELYVVVLDLATRQPVVFCRRTTPQVEVAGAVTSSAAIPGAFPPGRGVFRTSAPTATADGGERGAVVHQFVDGGAWANYPAFVFQDRSFRAWLRGQSETGSAADDQVWSDEEARPLVGFVLNDPSPETGDIPIGMVPVDDRKVNRRFDLGPTYTSKAPPSFIIGALLSSDWARLFIGVALTCWVTMSIAALPWGLRRLASWLDSWLPDLLYPVVLVTVCTILVLAATVAIALVAVLILLGRLLADTLLPSMQAIMGVPTDIPPWTGLGTDAIVVKVPSRGLQTTRFRIADEARSAAVAAAYHAARSQLFDPPHAHQLGPLPRTPEQPGTTSTDPPPQTLADQPQLPPAPSVDRLADRRPDRTSPLGVLIAAAAAFIIGVLGWWTVSVGTTAAIWRTAFLLLVGTVSVTACLLYTATRAGARASGRARFGVTASTCPTRRWPVAAGAAGVLAVTGGLWLSHAAMQHRDETVVAARIVAASVSEGGNRYTARTAGGELELRTERHLRLGEHVHLDTAAGRNQLVGALDDTRFAAAVVLVIFGVGLITSAVRSHRWKTRCVGLVTLVQRWDSGQTSARSAQPAGDTPTAGAPSPP